MQNEQLKGMSFVPDRNTTYSTASSFYGRESAYDFAPAPVQQQAPTPIQQPPAFASKSTPSIVFPSAEMLLSNGRLRSSNGSEPPARKRRKPSLNDPIQTHLLLQTALGDSGQYEILSFEELEGLKRETQSIRARINGLQKKLALETKVRDAAKSLVRLRSTPSSTTSSPRILRRSSTSKDPQDKAQMEYAEAVKKCEQLARELYNLEQRERQVQTRILQHTAGILQNTHHGFSKNQGLPFVPGGRPDSPTSLDGSQPRALNGEMDSYDAMHYNDSSIYDTMLEGLTTMGHKRQPSNVISAETSDQNREMMMYLGAGLEELNKRIAAVLGRTNTQKARQYEQFPDMVDEAVNVTFAQRLDQLTQGMEDIELEQDDLRGEAQMKLKDEAAKTMMLQAELETIRESQTRSLDDGEQVAKLQAELQASVQKNVALQTEYDRIEDTMSSQLGDINNELYQVLSSSSMNVARAPENAGPMDSLEYTKAQIASIRNLVQSSAASINDKRQADAVMEGLWSFIIGAEEDLRNHKRKEHEQLAQTRSGGAQVNSEDEVSSDEDDGSGQEFSMQAFNTKVQWLISQSLYSTEKQSSLRRKVKAHRERADRSLDSVAGNEGLKEQLGKAENLYATAREELRDLESRNAQMQQVQEQKDARIQALQGEIAKAATDVRNEAQAEIERLEEQLQNAEQNAANFERDLAAVKQDLASTTQEHQAATLSRSVEAEAGEKNGAELSELRDEIVRLKTELTFAQAELEGAYGSRSQRQRELANASNTEASKQLDVLFSKNAELEAQIAVFQQNSGSQEQQLRRELAETLKEFEELTKASVESEKEREDLENAIDKYRDKVEGLEAQIAEDSVRWLGIVGGVGEQSPGSVSVHGGGGVAQSMSVVVLKNEFKKMMREARVESLKQLRVSPSHNMLMDGTNELCRLSRTNGGDLKA